MAVNGRTTLYYVFQKKVLDPNAVRAGYKVLYEEVSRDTRTLGTLQIRQMLDSVPSVTMSIPVDALPKDDKGLPVTNLNNYRLLLCIYENGERKYGLACVIDSVEVNYATGVVQLVLSHRMAEMRAWLMPANLVVKHMTLGHCVENVAKLGFPDDYVKDEDSLRKINYIAATYVDPRGTYPTLPIGSATSHVQANYNALSENEKIYVPQEIPVTIEMDAYAYNTELEMTFGSTNKLEALAEIMKNTKDLHFLGTISGHEMWYEPTNGNFGDGVKISNFEDECDYSIIVTTNNAYTIIDDCDANPASNITVLTMLDDPIVSQNLADHFNRAAVFCGDVGDGILHLTLKEIYERPDLQDPNFPVEMYDKNINTQPEAQYNQNGTKINNEKEYENVDIPVMANNDNREYYVTDLQQLAEDNGLVFHNVYNFSDLYPIPDLDYTDEKGNKVELEITDGDRLEITKRAYNRAIRFLKAQRPQKVFQFNTTALPPIDMVGKKVRFMYKKFVTYVDECDKKVRQLVIDIDECFYITERIITFNENLQETATITLDKELRPNTAEEIAVELSKKGASTAEESELGTLYPEYGNSQWNKDMRPDTTDVDTDLTIPLSPDTGVGPTTSSRVSGGGGGGGGGGGN